MILITGANGQLAREFQKVLTKRGIIFKALTREELDISNFKKVKEVVKGLKPDFVINCAAYNFVDRAEEDWEKAFLVNGIGVKNLALASNEVNATLVHFSTDYVFDGEKGKPYTIADSPNPINRYGKSKLLGENFVRELSERYYLIRVSWLFGEGKNSFITKLLSWAKDKDVLRIVDDQISSPTYTEDLVRAVLDLLNTENYGLYHITNEGYCSRYEWAKFILEALNWRGKLIPAKSEEFKTLAKRPAFSKLDTFPLREVIGYQLPHWEDATERFLTHTTHFDGW